MMRNMSILWRAVLVGVLLCATSAAARRGAKRSWTNPKATPQDSDVFFSTSPDGDVSSSSFLSAAARSLLSKSSSSCPMFDKGQAATAAGRQKPKEKGIFEELDEKELLAVRDFLLSRPELNLAPDYASASANSSTIHYIELMAPRKAEALAHLDHGGPKPMRRALAVLFLLNATNPSLVHVEVGPLPQPSYYKDAPLGQHKGPISIHSRPSNEPELAKMDELLYEAAADLDSILVSILGGYHYPPDCDAEADQCLWWTDGGPRGWVNTQRLNWVWFMRLVDGTYGHPVGFEVMINSTGTDLDQWRIVRIMLGGKIFNTTQEVKAYYAANNDSFPGFKVYTPNSKEALYTSMEVEDVQSARPTNKRPGPICYEPYGKRYTISGSHISYMGWEFDVGVRTSAGTRLWDIRFKGERIVYELSLQQAYAAYGGSAVVQGMTHYFDQAWGMGASHHELYFGVDCPLNGQLLDMVHYWDGGEPYRLRNSVCVFEVDQGTPYRRHYDKDFLGGYRFYAGIRTHTLVVRAMSTVFNYDYVFDYIFYLDGTLEARMLAYGYPQAMHYAQGDEMYGYKFFHDVGGSVHDHMLHYKVDVDVNGTANSLQIDQIKVRPVDYSAWNPEVPSGYQKYVERVVVDSEDHAKFVINPATPKYYVVVNENSTNQWGAPRGIRLSHRSYIYQLLPDNTTIVKGADWTKYQLGVTKFKDEEYLSGSIFEQATPGSPVVDWGSFFDGDSLRGEDLVLWVNTGNWHIPVSEDAPNTPYSGVFNGFTLHPYNYFSKDAAMDLREIVVVHPDPQTQQAVQQDYGMPRDPTGGCRPKFPQGENVQFNGFY